MLKTVQLIVGVVQSICTDDVENSANLFNAIIIVIISQVTLNFKDEMTILTQEQPAVKKKKRRKNYHVLMESVKSLNYSFLRMV